MSPSAQALIDDLAAKADEFGGLIRDRIRAVRRGGAPEDIHQMRVAGRRLRAAVQVLHRICPDPRLVRIHDAARRLTKLAGKVREIDVALDGLTSPESPIPADVRTRARRILRRPLDRLRERERRRLKAALDRSVHSFPPPVEVERPGHSISPRSMLKGRLSQARRRYGKIRGREDVRRLHRFRISMKKLRYTAEILRPYPSVRRIVSVKRIKSVQSVLGRLHDDQVTAGLFRGVGRAMGRSEAAVVEQACRALHADANRQYRRLERIRMPWMG